MKKVIIGLSIAVLGFAAQAEYLYWTVNNEYTMNNTGATFSQSTGETSGVGEFMYGQIVRVTLTDGKESGAEVLDVAQYTVGEGDVQKSWPVEIASNTTYGYYIELLSWDGTNESQIGRTAAQTYEQLNTAGVIYKSDSLTPVAAATWHGGGAMNAPEPTSAMLMLLGAAGLALRRKQRKLA